MKNKLRTLLRQYRSNTVLHLLIIGISAIALFSISGLSAYLTDVSDPFNIPYHFRYGRDFSVAVDSISYHQGDETFEIFPDEPQNYDPYLINNSFYDAYMFLEVKIPDSSFELTNTNNHWYLLDSKNSDTYIYAYGTSEAMESVPAASLDSAGDYTSAETEPLDGSIRIGSPTSLEQGEYEVEATGYAIAADQINDASPESVWEMINDENQN